MSISILNQYNNSITLQVQIKFSRSMLDSESEIQNELNQAGVVATESLLKTFDTDGSPIMFGSVKRTSQGLVSKHYQTPYGEATVERKIYQTSKGGTTFCPLEQNARIIIASTPRFASQISHKMAEMSASKVSNDLQINHNRSIARNVVQRIADAVAAVVQIKEESWSYTVPNIAEKEIATVSVGLDGTCMLMCEDSYRQAMVGTIALYDALGERHHTTYIAAAPEYGKEKFKERLTREIENTKLLYKNAVYIGVADGAHDNWDFLKQHTTTQILDFYHASEYLTKVADVIFITQKDKDAWLDITCHKLKHEKGAANEILEQFKEFKKAEARLMKQQINVKLKSPEQVTQEIEKKLQPLESAITYFKNNIVASRMNYAEAVAANQPIGSGVTEAACKTIVKQRLCKSGMRWKDKGAASILSLRSLIHSTGRWEQFWSKIDQYGFPVAA